MKTASILYLTNDSAIKNSLEMFCSKANSTTIALTKPDELLDTVWRVSPTFVVIDTTHSGGNGFELCRQLRADRRSSQLPIIVLSEQIGEIDRILAYEFGADVILPTNFNSRELLAACKSLLRRIRPLPAERLNHGEISIDVGCRRVSYRGDDVSLTPMEFRILQYLAERPERVHGREQIMESVNADSSAKLERAIDPHINTIRRKLGPGGDCIETVRGFGYRLRAA